GQTVAGEVEGALGLGLALGGQEPGHVAGGDLGRVGPAGVQEGPAGAVDGAHLVLGQRLHAVVLGALGVQVVVEQPGPAPTQPQDLIAAVGGRVHQRLDARVQAGDVAATGQHTDPGHNSALRPGDWFEASWLLAATARSTSSRVSTPSGLPVRSTTGSRLTPLTSIVRNARTSGQSG